MKLKTHLRSVVTVGGIHAIDGNIITLTGDTITLANSGAGKDITVDDWNGSAFVTLKINNVIAGAGTGLAKLGADTFDSERSKHLDRHQCLRSRHTG
jgi:hypothetical protein